MKNVRLNELDGLRGIAALAVVLFHYLYRYDEVYGHAFSVPVWTKYGHYGVHLFFLISGFVIFWTISRAQRPFDFVWSRFSRLYPVYWVAIFITFTIVAIFGLPGREVSAVDLLFNLTMVHEYLGIPHVDGVYWSLTQELTFYAWMLALLVFNKIKHIEKLLLFWIIAATLICNEKFGLELSRRLRYLLLLDYISLFAAGICFYLIKNGTAKTITYWVLGVSVASLFIKYSLEIAGLLCAIYALFYLAISGRLTLLAYKPFVFMGTISYSFYLVHQNIGYLIINKFYAYGLSPYQGMAVALLTALFLATLLTFIVEKPSMSYLRDYYKKNNRIQQIANKFGRASTQS